MTLILDFKTSSTTPQAKISTGNRRLALTPYQEIFYNEWLIDPSRHDYNMVMDQIVAGQFEVAKLVDSIIALTNNYWLANSNIKKIDGKPFWIRRKPVAHAEELMTVYDRELTNDELLTIVQKPYDLEKDLLLRIYVIKLKNGHYRVINVIHHILIDGLSCKQLYDEMGSFYNDKDHCNPISLNEQEDLHSSLSDEIARILDENATAMHDFWKQQLAGIAGPDLRFLKSHPADQTPATGNLISEFRFSFDEQVFAQIRQLTRKYKQTPYIFGQLVFAITLHKMTGQESIGISFPTAILEGKDLIFGAHINSIIIPYRFTEATTLKDLLDDTAQFYAGLKNSKAKYLPVHEILKYTDTTGLLDLGFVQTDLKDNAIHYNDTVHLEIRSDLNIDVSNSMIFEQEIRNNIINYRIRYNNRQLSGDRVSDFINRYQKMFRQILTDLVKDRTDKKISEYSLVDQNELANIITRQSANVRPYQKNKTVHQLFEEQVARTPQRIAVVYENTKLTYDELNRRANRLAGYLRQKYDIKPDDFIALCVDRSEHMLIGILAILKAGGAYVPIDPKYPQDRIRYMLQDTAAKVVLANDSHLDLLTQSAPGAGIAIACIDNENFNRALAIFGSHNLAGTVSPANLFYIVYTSGTTGNPKGVMIEHRHITPVIHAIREAYEFGDSPAKISAFTSFGFDVSTSEFFISLLYGNELHLLSDLVRTEVNALSAYLLTNEIGYVYLPPVVLAALPKTDYPHLKTIIYAGEPCDLETGKYWSSKKRLYNYYGPSETNIATGKLIENGDVHLIGSPVANATVYVLDKSGNNLPQGAIGELYIGGDALARGYLNLPQLTTARFIKNPFQSNEDKITGRNERLYKTGDLVRYNFEGYLEYIGRNDFQVKIRGFRVELGEIETRLSAYQGVRQAIVLVSQKGTTKTSYLVGYYLSDEAIDQEVLISYLSHHLPEYMVPAVLVHLKKLPLTINGKVDRKALPDAEFTGSVTYHAPENSAQEAICSIYGEITSLDPSQISIDDNFFRLGGNSIGCIKLISRLDEVFGKTVKVADVYSCKTVRKLSELLQSTSSGPVKIIAADDGSEPESLSFAQERLLFIDTYDGESKAYNIPVAFRLKAATDTDSFLAGLRAIVRRHQVLRSLIKTDRDGVSTLSVQDDVLFPLTITRQTVYSQQELDEAIDWLFAYSFKLREEYPIRVQVYDLHVSSQHTETYVVLVVHHIAFDGWSADIMMRELNHFYRYYEEIKTMQVAAAELHFPAPLALQYKDFASWQRGYLTGDILATQLSYWKSKLALSEPLSLATDRKRSAKLSYEGADVHFEIESHTSERLRKAAMNMDVSLYSLLLSGYYLLLNAYSGQEDIVVGTPVANRHYPELQHTIGLFVNTLALRQVINYDERLTDFIKAVGRSVDEAQLYQDLPFEKLVAELSTDHDASLHPVFQVMFGVQHFGPGKNNKGNDLFDVYHTAASRTHRPAKFDLTTMLDDSESAISGSFNYATSLFDETTIRSYADTFITILTQIAGLTDTAQEHKKLKDISFLNAPVRHKILTGWNATEQTYPGNKTMHQLFEEQTKRTPDNIAVVYENIQLTYRQLDERSNQLGAWLRDKYAIGPDDLVALCMQRSEHMLITILGVLKAGGAYVPIDPSLPQERIAYILHDTGSRILLTNEESILKLNECLPQGVQMECVDCTSVQQTISTYPALHLPAYTTSGHLAYVMYTSGTSGNPKGAMLEHRGLVNTIVWLDKCSPLKETDRMLQKTPYVFDPSVIELFWPIWYGAAVVFARPDGHKDTAYLAHIIGRDSISVINFVPSMLTPFLEALESSELSTEDMSSLRLIFCIGEALPLQQVKKAHRLMPHASVHNLYGPTEASINLLHYDCSAKDIQEILIGRPISNTKIFILDSQLRPVPPRASGELYLSGDGLARGYLNLPQLTEDRFIPNPFQTAEDRAANRYGRMYRTGDLARYLPDGNVDYLGRNDFQVKINGMRIELGEIEVRLAAVPGIQQAVVMSRTHRTSGAQYLAAYYIAEKEMDHQGLRTALASCLPEYMVPAHFIHLHQFPLSVSGKADRKQLPEPDFFSTNSYAAPENEIQNKLCSIFAGLLEIDIAVIGINDDFFKLGGNSIMSIRLLSQINNTFNSGLRIADIFLTRTVKSIALKISEVLNGGQLLMKLNAATAKTNMFMIHPGLAGCEVYIPLAQQLEKNFSCHGLDSYNLYSGNKIEDLEKLASHYLSLINEVRHASPDQPITLLGWSLGGLIAMQIAAILEKEGKKNITIYALDTIIYAGILKEGFAEVTKEEMKEILKEMNIPVAEYDRYRTLYDTESRLMGQKISQKLQHTKIVSFKAMLTDTRLKKSGRASLSDAIANADDNYISRILCAPEQLRIVKMPRSTHWNILTQIQSLVAEIETPW